MRTAVVILNWNTRDYLAQFIPVVEESLRGLDAGLVVADNASSDGSAEMLAEHFPRVRTIRLGENFGFTGGYNRAFAQLLDGGEDEPEYLVLLNSDVLASPDWLAALIAYMDAHPDCGVCGPKLLALLHEGGEYRRGDRLEYAGAAGGCLDRYGYPFCRGRVLARTDMDSPRYGSVKDVLWVSGACLMTRSALWKSVGGLDDRFFAHMEEIDYCWKVQLLGYRVSVVPSSVVYHLGGGTLPRTSPAKLKLNYRNGLLLLDNNLASTIGPRKARRRIRTRKLLDLCSALAYLLSGRRDDFRAVLEAHREYRTLRASPRRIAEPKGRPAGLTDICIILQSMLRGKRIFDYLQRYEDSH